MGRLILMVRMLVGTIFLWHFGNTAETLNNSVEILGDLGFGNVFRYNIKSMTHERIHLSLLEMESCPLRKIELRE